MKVRCAILGIVAAILPVSAQTVFNVRDFGTAGNGTTLDTAAIQSAVNAAHQAGGGIVSFPPGTYKMAGVRLTNDITVSFTNGAFLVASTNQGDWSGAVTKIFYATNCTNITLTGPALMDGGGLFFYQGDPGNVISGKTLQHMLEFHYCTNVTLSGLHLQNSCEQTITFNDCSNVTVLSVTVTNRPREFGSGDDGIDFSDCISVLASNLNIETGDDGICVKTETNHLGAHDILIENSTVATTTMATKFGTATYSPAYNVVFSNITVNLHPGIVIGANNPLPDGRCEAAINVCMCNGGFNHDILFTHYTINECSIPIYAEVNDRSGNGFGISSNIFFGDINCLNASNACQINVQSGATNNFFALTFSNLTVHNFETYSGTSSPPFQDNGYPYGYQIGSTIIHMPAYGFFARYVKGLTFAGNNQFFDDGNSGRANAIVLENVTTNLPSAPTNNGAFIFKADNNFSLDQNSSWTNGIAPGKTNVAVWDSTVATAANCTNALNANANWDGILILNPAAPVTIPTTSTGSLFLGSNGIDLSAATVNLQIGVPTTTAQPQTWTIDAGRALNFFATNKTVNVASNLTVAGAVNFSGSFNVSSNGILTIPAGSILSATNLRITNSFSVLSVGADTTGGTVNQTGGNVILNSVGGTSGNPKVSMHIATAANSRGVFNLLGGSLVDTTTNTGSDCIVGDATGATGIFNLSGGSAQFVSLRIGNNGGAGIVNVTNGNLSVTGGEFSIGRGSASGSAGTLNIFGGAISANVNLQLSHGLGPGILNLNGGIISVPAITSATSAGTLNWNGGILQAATNSANFISNAIAVNVGAGGAIFDTTNFNATLSANLLNGTGGNADGGFTKLGGGALALTGSNTFNGPLVVGAGILIVSNVNAIASSTNISVAAGATLNLTGIGTLDLNSAPVLNGTLVLQIRKSGTALANDQLSVGDSAFNFGGALTVIASGNALAAGDEFDLFDASEFSGNFSTLNLPSLPSGLVWDSSSLEIDGTIKVAPQTTAISFHFISAAGTNFVFSGTGGIASNIFYIATSTNLALPLADWTILSTNHFDANGNFQITNAMNPTIASQFFALLLSLPSQQTNSQSQADTEIVTMLQNIRDNGWDAVTNLDGGVGTNINNGLGGLWVNWRYGTSPLLVNFNGSGSPDGASVNPPRHDELTDLRYLHNLWWYKKFHPTDTQFDADIAKYTTIVKTEFTTNVTNERGWMYDEELIPLWQLSGDDFYRQAAFNQAGYFANTLYNPAIGAYYDTSSAATNGYYRVDWQLEIGCALIHAGTIFTNASWAAKGSNMVEFVYSHAYLTNYHHFLQDMSNVVSNGVAIANENIFVSGGTDGGAVRMSPLGQEALSLLHVYLVTSNQLYLNRAMDLLTPEMMETNSFGLWDTNYGGYYGGLEFSGPTFQNAGTPALITKKEGGRQMDMLEAFHLANTVTTNRYAATEAALKNVLLNKTYYAAGHGILYEVNADWSVRTISGQPEDWVTTEAMGIVLEALFSLEDSQPW